MKDETQFLFRFKTLEQRKAFKIQAILANKSMNALIGELIESFLQESKKEVA